MNRASLPMRRHWKILVPGLGVFFAALILFLQVRSAPDGLKHIEGVAFESAGHLLVGDLFYPRFPNGQGILLLHGSSRFGRKLELYPQMAMELARRGFVVLNLDHRGYGESENPQRPDQLEDWDFAGDVHRVLDHLLARPEFEVLRWSTVGHSKGGGVAMTAGMADDRVHAVVSISPGRRFRWLFVEAEDAESRLDSARVRKSEHMQLPEPIAPELMWPILESYSVERFANSELPKPLLYIEGSREPEADLRFSAELIDSMTGPVDFVLIRGADHYFGAAIVDTDEGRRWQIHRPEIFQELVNTISDWLYETVGVAP